MPNRPIVSVLDDDSTVCDAIAALGERLGVDVQRCRSAAEFLAGNHQESAGCLVVNAELPDGSGLELQSRLTAQRVFRPVIMVGNRPDVPLAVRAMRGGATTFLVKPLEAEQLCAEIEEALRLDERRRRSFESRAAIEASVANLTPRERQVMDYLVAGKNTKQVAEILSISTTTVDKHRWKILEKMGVDSIVSLVNRLLERQDPPGEWSLQPVDGSH
jgi:FixJ family two-component response regulator